MIPCGVYVIAALTFGFKVGAEALDNESSLFAAGRGAHAGTPKADSILLQSSYSRKAAQASLSNSADDCEGLKDVVVANHSVGRLLSPLCSVWPFGEFPIADVSQANKVLDAVFKKGGVWDAVKSLSKDRSSKKDKFCWRREAVREIMEPGGETECPSPISSQLEEGTSKTNYDRLEDEDADKLKQGKWSCKNSGTDKCSCEKQSCTTTGSKPCVFPFYYAGEKHTSCTKAGDSERRWCATETNSAGNYIWGKWDYCDEEACDETAYEYHVGACRTANMGRGPFKKITDAKEACKEACSEDSSCVAYEFASPDQCEIHWGDITRGAGGNSTYSCYIKQDGTSPQQVPTHEDVSAVDSACHMTSGKTCYKQCPLGFEPLPLTGGFRPICQTECTASNHHIPCGFGCANRVSSCVDAVVTQIGTVVKAVSRVVSLFVGLPGVVDFFDALLSLVDFAITTLPKLIGFFKNAWDEWNGLGELQSGEKTVGVIITLMELATEAKSSFISTFLEMHESAKEIPKMFTELLEAEWDWGLDLDKISSIFEQFKPSDFLLGMKLVEAFNFPKCDVADRTPKFSITHIGDPRFIGQWMEQGVHLGRPRYRLINDTQDAEVPMIHWSSKNYWRAYIDNDWHWYRTTYYTNPKNTSTPPSDGWELDQGAEPAPTLQLMAQ